MKRGGPTRLGVVLLVLIVAVLMIGTLIWAGRTLFGGSRSDSASAESAGQKLLSKPTDSTAVIMSVRGPIVAQEAHYSIVIKIGQNSRNLIFFRGYDGTTMRDIRLGNSKSAFSDFLAALNRAGYMESNDSGDDNQGICATGQLIQFEILDGDKTAEKLWTTSCNDISGNFDGLATNVISLFLTQIPGSRSTIDNARNQLNQEQTEINLKALR